MVMCLFKIRANDTTLYNTGLVVSPQYTESRYCELTRNLQISDVFTAVKLSVTFVWDMTLGLWANRIPRFRDNAVSSISTVETSYPERTDLNI
jgi:hypothetical protein